MKSCSKVTVLLSATLTVFLAGIGGTARAQPYAYVTNYNTGALSVIDTDTDTVVDSVPDVGDGSIVLHPDGTTAFITDRASNTIAIMDVATRQVVDRLPLGAYPLGLAVTPEGDRVYVLRLNHAEPLVFFGVAERLVTTSAAVRYNDLDGIAIGPGRRGYVIGDGRAALVAFDLDADAFVYRIQADELFTPNFVVFNCITPTADGAFLWAADTYFGTLTAIDLRSREGGNGIPAPIGSREMVLNHSETRVYMADGNNIVVFDRGPGVGVPLGAEARRVALTPDDARAFITLSSGSVAVLDTASLTVVDLFPVEPGISAIAIPP